MILADLLRILAAILLCLVIALGEGAFWIVVLRLGRKHALDPFRARAEEQSRHEMRNR